MRFFFLIYPLINYFSYIILEFYCTTRYLFRLLFIAWFEGSMLFVSFRIALWTFTDTHLYLNISTIGPQYFKKVSQIIIILGIPIDIAGIKRMRKDDISTKITFTRWVQQVLYFDYSWIRTADGGLVQPTLNTSKYLEISYLISLSTSRENSKPLPLILESDYDGVMIGVTTVLPNGTKSLLQPPISDIFRVFSHSRAYIIVVGDRNINQICLLFIKIYSHRFNIFLYPICCDAQCVP